MRSDLPTGTVTFLFTDVEGSTRLLHRLGPDAYADALAEHRRALREAFAAHGGVEVDTQGDAFFVAFPTASGAAAAAIAMHDALDGSPIRVRMGMHAGTPTVTDDGYVGVDVHRAARIASLAHGNQTIVSETAAAFIDAERLADLGRHRLKDFDAPIRLLQLGTAAFPSVRTPGAVDLPTPATAFLGREAELYAAVAVVLERDPRILTIVGPGGTGKTRFAIELARLLAEEADGGTVFVPLAPLRDASHVIPTVADRLGAASPEVPGHRSAHRSETDARRARQPRAASPRRSVGRRGARRGRAQPAAARHEPRSGACTRRGRVRPAAALGGRSRRAVPQSLTRGPYGCPPTTAVDTLCERLDRLPLALELAAARTKLLTPDALLERLGSGLTFSEAPRDSDPRHATLRTTIAWSYDLLSPDEQRLLARLSVFAAGCTLDSAEAVCDADLETLGSLLDKSLLRRRTGALARERFWLLETIREFAWERLEGFGELEVRARHARRMLSIARSANLEDAGVVEGEQRHEVVQAELDDMRAALDWAVQDDVELGFELVTALEGHWVAAHPVEGQRRVEQLFEQADAASPALRAAALRLRGSLTYLLGDFERGRLMIRESMTAFQALGDERGAANLLGRIAVDAGYFGDVADARSLAHEALELSRKLDMPRLEAEALAALADTHRRENDALEAWELTRRSADVAATCGFVWWQAHCLQSLVELGALIGRLADAEQAGREALRLERRMSERGLLLWTLTGLAVIEHARHDLGRAGRLFGAAAAAALRDPPRQAEDLAKYAAPLEALHRSGVPRGPRRRCRDGARRGCRLRARRGSDRSVELQDHRDVLLGVVEQPALPNGTRSLVVARKREPPVASELVELPAQVPHPGANVARGVTRRAHSEQHHVHPFPCLGQQLHHPDRADAGDDVLLETRLHPRERPGEPRVDAVDGRPVVDLGPDRAARCRCDAFGVRADRQPKSLAGDDDPCEAQSVDAGQLPGAHVVALRDGEEALACRHHVHRERAGLRA